MYGILVNSDGVQFANLHDWAKAVMPPLLAHEPATCWWIFDEASKPQFVVSGTEWTKYEKVERLILNNRDLVRKADTISELAEQVGLPAAALEETVRRWNEMVEQGEDVDFHRFGPGKTEYNFKASPKIETPPFYAMQSWPITRKSMGGVAIDLECRVTDQAGQPIPGLYAVGELTGLAGINGRAALEGTFLGPCVLTGRVAAKSILGTLEELTPSKHAEIASERCADCHDIPDLIANKREGYWHFEECHRVVLERKLNCLQCHGELAPYNETTHHVQQDSLTPACIQCHIAVE
jgi:succinate dehydrogenase/fumarate reductase flavoprotein subunit